MQYWYLFRDAILTWTQAEADQHAAATSYFVPFALVPLIFVSLAIVGFFIGTAELIVMLARWGEVIDPTLPDLITESLTQLTSLANTFPIPVFAILFFSIMILIALNSITAGLHAIFGITARGWRFSIERYIRAFLFVLLLQGYFVFVILLNRIVEYLAAVLHQSIAVILVPVLFFCATIGLLTIGYWLLPLQAPSWRARLVGAIAATILLVAARFVVALHLTTTPTATLYGAATSIILLLVWLYTVLAIVLFGAAVAKVYDARPHLTT